MTDLSYCYLHMTAEKIASFDFNDEIDFTLEEETDILDIPDEHVPPDPDDADCLPSQMHLSYPYGNPTKLNHPAALGTYPFGQGHAHLYSQISYDLTEQNNSSSSSRPPLQWNDRALDELLPADPKKMEAERAAKARRNATGAVQNGNGGPSAEGQAQDAPPPPDLRFRDSDSGSDSMDNLDDDEEGNTDDEDF